MAKDKNRVSIDDMEDDFSKEIPGAVKAKSKIDEWLTGNVVEPLAARGYPNLGAGLATVPSTIAEFLAPTTPGEFAPGMAGVGKLRRQNKNLLKKIEKSMDDSAPKFTRHYEARKKLERAGSLFGSDKYGKAANEIFQDDFLNKIGEEDVKKGQKLLAQKAKDIKNKEFIEQSDIGIMDKKKFSEDLIRKNNEALLLANRALFGKQNKPYLRPKGYANQKSTKLPKQEIMSKEPSRTDYDKMLGGTNPGQQYFDEMSEGYRKFIEGEQEPDFFKDYIKNSWKGK